MRLGIFGGSFDPVHIGHLIVARIALEALNLDRLHFVLARSQPLKLGRHEAAPEQRADMLRLALEGVPDFRPDLRELSRPGPSYTIDTLREMSAESPGYELTLMVGADAALQITEWKDAGRLKDYARLAVLSRPGVPQPPPELDAIPVKVPLVEIEASDIRQRVREGKSIRFMVPERVARYIEDNGIYR